MTELRTELSDLALAREQVAGIATSLTQERSTLHGSMQEFLGSGWTGVAADEFAAAWGDWNTAAQEMLDGLQAMGRLLEAARVDYVTTDDGVHGDMARLSVRLGPRGAGS
ncbi:MAG: WXG100 family type VII secretion target [Nocardioides sp.]|nr:WXG100 family type VII secretion target [Nocardioides sp.]